MLSHFIRSDSIVSGKASALANVGSPILPALLDACQKDGTPLHFVSWHIYSSSPGRIRKTVAYVKDLLPKYPRLKPETALNEWNMDLQDPPLDPRLFAERLGAEGIGQFLQGRIIFGRQPGEPRVVSPRDLSDYQREQDGGPVAHGGSTGRARVAALLAPAR